MNPVIEKLYYSLPIWAQDIAVSVYGIKLFYERYGGIHKQYFERLQQTEFFSKNNMDEIVDRLFIKTIRHAASNVPFYRKLIEKKKVNINEFNSIADIVKLPIVSKQMLQEKPQDFMASNFKKRQLLVTNTSGTSGKPLNIFIDKDSRHRAYAFFSLSKNI